MINYLFSRINHEKGFTKKQKEYLLQDIKNNSIITFISAYKNEPEKQKESIENKLFAFNKINISFKKINVIDALTPKDVANKYIDETDVLFLLGGAPHIQMETINKNELTNKIKNINIVIGVSAGSMNQAKKVIYIDEYDNNILRKYEGLNLVDTYIFPHLNWRNKNLVNEAIMVSKTEPLIMIPDQTFIRIKQNQKEIIGKYYPVNNGIIDKSRN